MTSPTSPADDLAAAAVCFGCNAAVQLDWRHCAPCGARLATDDEPERQHVVTVVVSDLQGSTALAEALDPESLRLVLDRYFDELGAVLESHGGRIEKRIGDMMVTVFGLPVARPDDAVRALRGASESQQTLASLNERLHAGWGVRLTNRTGVSTGTVVYATAGGAHRVLAGDALEQAGALEPLAPPLEVLVSEATTALVGDHATFDALESYVPKSGGMLRAGRLLTVDAGEPEPVAVPDGRTCSGCGAAATEGASWCVACGSPLVRSNRRRESRRTLTIVFADLKLHHVREGVDATAERAAMLAAFNAARRALDMHGGTVENFIGDAVMAVFGLDRRHEDDALRAIRAALDVHKQLDSIAEDLAHRHGLRVVARVGVNTGPVIAGDPGAGERLVTGDAVNVAARLEQTAQPGDVVIGDLTRQLAGSSVTLEPLPPLTLKGKAEPVPAYRVRDVQNIEAVKRRFELPFIGRDSDLALLREAWNEVTALSRWQRVRIVGDAGIGKSRLVYQLLDELRGAAQVMRGACLPYGEGITFWPVAEIIRASAGITTGTDVVVAKQAISAVSPDEEVAVRLQSLLGLDERNVPVTELFWAIRRFFEHRAQERPLVVVIDGLQWAEPTLIDLLDDLVANGDAVPVLLVTMERAATQIDEMVTIDLQPLDDAICHTLLVDALGPAAMPAALRSNIVRSSAGVPLFIEQLLTMLIDDGRLVDDGGGWRMTVAVEDLTIPPTIEALLAARVDALPADEVGVIEPASVIGREFSITAVTVLRGAAIADGVMTSLDRRQLVAPSGAADALTEYRFRNLLIRDVVYDGLLKRTRASLHQQFAEWLLDGPAAGHITEIEEIIGYHFERAYRLGAEVSAVDDATAAVGGMASHHLGAAGERAFARGDMPAAANLLQRAAGTMHGGGVRAARLLVQAGDARLETGAFTEATKCYNQAEELAQSAGDAAAAAAAALARTTLGYLTGDGVDEAAAIGVTDRLLPIFHVAEDHAGTARCWRLRTYVEMFHCHWGAAEGSATETIRYAQQAGDQVLEHRVLPALAGFALYGPTPVAGALAVCSQLLVDAGSDSRSRSLIEQFSSHLLALSGEFDQARELCHGARTSLQELGWNFDAALVSIHLGPIELMADRPEAAEAELRRDYDTLRNMGERNYLSTTAYLLGEAIRRQGRFDEAVALAMESKSLAADDDVFSQIGWRSLLLRTRAAAGELDDALALAEEVRDLAFATDGPNAHGEALLDLAQVLVRRGDVTAAMDLATTAESLFAAKGSRVAQRRALDLADSLR
jgi:class 3 adenylate cyclase/tetratricopeptide (TPR) repeat protein